MYILRGGTLTIASGSHVADAYGENTEDEMNNLHDPVQVADQERGLDYAEHDYGRADNQSTESEDPATTFGKCLRGADQP